MSNVNSTKTSFVSYEQALDFASIAKNTRKVLSVESRGGSVIDVWKASMELPAEATARKRVSVHRSLFLVPQSPVVHKQHSESSISRRSQARKSISVGHSLVTTGNHNTGIGQSGDKSKGYQVGRIVQVSWVQTSNNQYGSCRESEDGNYVSSSKVGLICAKLRYGVVVGVHRYHMTVAPIYSSGGSGLKSKPTEYRYECLAFLSPSGEQPIIYEGMRSNFLCARDNQFVPKENSYVMLTQSFPVDYETRIRVVGSLYDSSANLMQKMFAILTLKGLEPRCSKSKFQISQEAKFEDYKGGKLVLERPDAVEKLQRELNGETDGFETPAYHRAKSVKLLGGTHYSLRSSREKDVSSYVENPVTA